MAASRVSDLSRKRAAAGRKGGRRSGQVRRQQAAETVYITVKLQPAHELSPEQLAAWRSFWLALFAAEPELPAGEEAADADA